MEQYWGKELRSGNLPPTVWRLDGLFAAPNLRIPSSEINGVILNAVCVLYQRPFLQWLSQVTEKWRFESGKWFPVPSESYIQAFLITYNYEKRY